MADREVASKCSWCLLPRDSVHPVESISMDDPLPEDRLALEQCLI
jgi:hypothetical protein